MKWKKKEKLDSESKDSNRRVLEQVERENGLLGCDQSISGEFFQLRPCASRRGARP